MNVPAENIHQVRGLINKLGIPSSNTYERELEKLDIELFKEFDFMPDVLLLIRSYIVNESFTHTIEGFETPEEYIIFSFHSVSVVGPETTDKPLSKLGEEAPYVLVFPSSLKQEIRFKAGTQVKHITIRMRKDYLNRFLNEEVPRFDFLLSQRETFLIEELLTDDLLRIVNAIVKPYTDTVLEGFYYKLKTIELAFTLCRSLANRTKVKRQPIREAEIKLLYQIRDKILSSLSEFCSIDELEKLAGMNELKLRKLFVQVFGMSFFDYYQQFRMMEASRLLREENLSVSEVGYQLGFANLSHFSRVFEKHIGQKPKKYSQGFQ